MSSLEEAAVWTAVEAIKRGDPPPALNERQQAYLLARFVDALATFESLPAAEQARLLQVRREAVYAER